MRHRIPQAVPVKDTYRDHLRDAGEIVAGFLTVVTFLFLLFWVLPVIVLVQS